MSRTLIWVLIVVAVLVVGALIAAAFLLGRRAPKRKAPSVKLHSLADAWREILNKLPPLARSLPVVVVMGEPGTGKSRLIRAVFAARTGFSGEPFSARDGAAVSAFNPGQVLVQEVSGDLFEAEGSDGLVRLHDLWEPMALEIALVVFVGPLSSSAERQAQRVRRVLDLLTDLRGGSAPRCCLCVTRLDESTEGFAELVSSAERAGADTQSAISIASAAELEAIWDERFRDCYYAALAQLPLSEFVRATRFPEKSGPELADYVAALLRGVLRGRAPGAPIQLALAAIPEQGSSVLFGDPFAPDDARLADDRRVLERRRALRAAGFTAAACVIVTLLYAWHQGTVDRSLEAVAAFRMAALRAKSGERRLWATVVAEPELQAASAIEAAESPLYLPLRLAFPKQKHAAVQDFLTQIRELRLIPLSVAPDRATRVYAASLLFATREGALGRSIRPSAERWSSNLNLPASTVEHYLDYSKQAWSGKLASPPVAEQDVQLEEWSAFLARLDGVIDRGRLQRPEELTELQAEAGKLTAAMRWAVQEPELRPVIQLLEYERGSAEVERLLGGKSASVLQAPDWVNEYREALQTVLARVRKAEVSTPNAAGKSLRQALVDLDAIAAPAALSPGPAATLEVDGKTKVYPPDAWAKVLSESRATFYLGALLGNLTSTGRSLFFVDPRNYPNLPQSPVLGRGPSASIAGIYTRAAFNTEIGGPLAALDAKLESLKIPDAQRATLKGMIQRELDTYATGLGSSLSAYLGSFRFEATDVATLRASLAEVSSGSSWFTEFWANIASSAGIELGEKEQLRSIRRAVAPFAPIVTLLVEEKGAYPNLQPYTASLAKLIPALEAAPLLGAEPPSGALADRVSPIGKLGLALLDPEKPGPLLSVDDWLTKSSVLDEQQRAPFRAPVLAVYEQALRAVEQVAASAYTREIRPLVQPLFAQFPFDPSAGSDAVPADVQAVLGPKGSFFSAFQAIYGPLSARDQKQNFVPRKVSGFRTVALSREALELGKWVSLLSPSLWEASGEPKPMSLLLRPIPLAEIRAGTEAATSLGVLRSGPITVAAFNQATTWQSLPIEWWTASPAAIGIEFTALDGSSRRALSAEASGAAWRFFHLLCRGSLSGGVVRWSLDGSHDRDVAFELKSDPWEPLVPPSNRGRRCSVESGD